MAENELDHGNNRPAGLDPSTGEANRRGSSAISLRSALWVVGSLAIAVLGLALALRYFVAENLPALTEATLEKGMERWEANGPANYDLDLELGGAQPGLVHVEVRNKTVTHETRGGRTPPAWTWDTWSVPGMFDTLNQDIAIAANPEQAINAAAGAKWYLRCEFDPNYGYPLRYQRLVTSGPEVNWRVTKFTVQ